ncbi:hypothetical protein LBMAG49_19340 [Planctomycetota bacterium]|nr:hypothetical protein LBMAG49_19340 [Planctomycetota bacterium]
MHVNSLLPIAGISLCLVTAALAEEAHAQWADLSLPTGVLPGNVFNLGKMTHYLANGAVHVYSAFTREWASMPVSATANTTQTNDWLLIRDGATWTAFAAMRGRFEALPVSANAVLVNPIAQNNDSVLFVRDGFALYAFSGFVGRWSQRSIGASASVAVQRHVGLLADASLLAGYDSFSGLWHDLTIASQATALSCDGTAATAIAGNTIYGFSGLRGTWQIAQGFNNPTFTRGDDWAVYRSGTSALGFSGLLGNFATTPIGPVQSSQTQDLFGAFLTSAGTLQLYSAVTGTWSITAISTAASVRTAQAIALIQDPPLIMAWSAVHATFATAPLLSAGADLAGSVAAILPSNGSAPICYSATTGRFHVAPSDALPFLPRTTTVAALLQTPTGFHAFSARTGNFISLTSVNGIAEGNSAVAPALVWDSTTLHFFDARRDVWLHEPRQSTYSLGITLWRTTALIFDGNDAIAFGTQSGAVARITLPEPPINWRANSESLGITTSHHLFSASALPEALSQSQFPDFRRPFVGGADLHLQLRLPIGDLACFGIGMGNPSPVTLPGLGELLLDPAFTTVTLALPEADSDRAILQFAVPDSAILRGTQFWCQALVIDALGSTYLTDAHTFLVL